MSGSVAPAPDAALDHFLLAHGLAAPREAARWTPLTGGVSSDIWRVELPGRTLCVKRALPRLRVAAEWHAPVSRNAHEWAWLRFARRHVPHAVPEPLAHDPHAGLFAMQYLPPADHPLWKAQLLSGDIDVAMAEAVGRVMARLHTASAAHPELAREFDTLAAFRALRLEPYLLATAARHPDLSAALHALVERTAATRTALVHGDVSPKNILAGPHGPVILDAECAWWGDPAFDLAFCLNHLLLKCLVRSDDTDRLLESFEGLARCYLGGAQFEPRDALESRAASLLPALMLARVDGKSPVEYVHGNAARSGLVRDVARPLVATPPNTLAAVAGAWASALAERSASLRDAAGGASDLHAAQPGDRPAGAS